MAALPGSYAQMKADTPRLGAPLPGDLGRPILERQGQFGAAAGSADQAAEAERQRLAQQSEKAHEAGLFFQLNARPSQVDPAATGQGTIGPMAAAPAAGEQPRLALDLAKDQNNQQRKLDFLDQRDAKGIYDRHSLQTPVSPYQVMRAASSPPA